MNTTWETAIAFVLKQEGGYTLDVNDNGGETNFGISKRSYPNEDIRNMTEARAREIYQKDFWQALRCDELPFPLDFIMFDASVNQGDGAAPRMLQIALGVTVDGVIGEKTITAAFKSGAEMPRHFMTQRMARYIRTVLHDATQEVFAENWSNRLMSLAELIFAPVSPAKILATM